MVAARGARDRERPGAIERTRCLERQQLGHKKVDCLNRDTTKIGRGGGQMDVIHEKVPVNEGSGKRCSLHKNIAHSNAEGSKQRNSKEVAQTSTAVQITRQRTQSSVAHGTWVTGMVTAHNFAKGFLYTVKVESASKQKFSEHQIAMIADIGASLSCIDET